MEIEKKFLVHKIPENIEQYKADEIEQCYLCTSPTLRIRKKNDDYILTYKKRADVSEGEKLCVSDEREMPLDKESYEHLKTKADGTPISKKRVNIPYGKYKIELDIFQGGYEGLILAEVEFESVEESRQFTPPDWFAEDVSGDYHYTNSYLAQKNPGHGKTI